MSSLVTPCLLQIIGMRDFVLARLLSVSGMLLSAKRASDGYQAPVSWLVIRVSKIELSLPAAINSSIRTLSVISMTCSRVKRFLFSAFSAASLAFCSARSLLFLSLSLAASCFSSSLKSRSRLLSSLCSSMSGVSIPADLNVQTFFAIDFAISIMPLETGCMSISDLPSDMYVGTGVIRLMAKTHGIFVSFVLLSCSKVNP
jgi:hypothetical protein